MGPPNPCWAKFSSVYEGHWSCALVASGVFSEAHQGQVGLPAVSVSLRMAVPVKKSYFLFLEETGCDVFNAF